MKKYEILLFDVDDTLLDFKAAEKVALKQLFEQFGFIHTPEMEAHYSALNQRLWELFEEGELSREEVLNSRFSRFFKEYGIDVDGAELEANFRKYLSEGHQLIDGALDVLTTLKDDYQLYIVTNGVAETQSKRLQAAGVTSLFDGIFVSESTGFQKPMKQFFDHVFDQIPNVDVATTAIIGDSLTSDIKGGYVAGIDTIWFNPNQQQNKTSIEPTYEISKLTDLYTILY